MVDYRYILGMRVDGTSYADATRQVVDWSKAALSKYVCVVNVHVTMEAYDSAEFQSVVNEADLVTPDGMPLVLALRMMGLRGQSRVYGPTLTLHICAAAEKEGIPIGLYGGTVESLDSFVAFLAERYPRLRVACKISPPFRALTREEDLEYTNAIASSGARILLVGIGCPKQERWMAEHKNRIPAVMLGVGAAFDFHSGRIRQAPAWMQRISMEWLFRLLMEPRRLWKRYLKHNPRFVALLLWQLMRLRRCEEVGS